MQSSDDVYLLHIVQNGDGILVAEQVPAPSTFLRQWQVYFALLYSYIWAGFDDGSLLSYLSSSSRSLSLSKLQEQPIACQSTNFSTTLPGKGFKEASWYFMGPSYSATCQPLRSLRVRQVEGWFSCRKTEPQIFHWVRRTLLVSLLNSSS